MAWTAHKDEESMKEHIHPEETLDAQAKELAQWIRESNHTVFFTGAGISTSAGIPDYRGPEGAWTLRAQGRRRTKPTTPMLQAMPTLGHMSLVSMQRAGLAHFLISQNTDGIHRRSGFPPECLAELHGNTNLERCVTCGKQYMRDFSTRTARGSKEHLTGRLCSVPGCGGKLMDTIINFGENLPEKELFAGFEHAEKADLHICLGSSLTVTPAADMPKRTAKKGGKLVIVNLQKTPLDRYATMRVFGKIDNFMSKVMAHLELPVVPFKLHRRARLTPRSDGSIQLSSVDVDDTPMTLFRAFKGPDGKVHNQEPFLVHPDPEAKTFDCKVGLWGHYGEPPIDLKACDVKAIRAKGAQTFSLLYDPSNGHWEITDEDSGHRVVQKPPAPSAAQASTNSSDKAEASESPSSSSSSKPQKLPVYDGPMTEHNALCDMCRGRIVGLRFHCNDCGDFDLCMKCMPTCKDHDPAHVFQAHALQIPEHVIKAQIQAAGEGAASAKPVPKPELSVFEGGGFAVTPIDDCPHVALIKSWLEGPAVPSPCSECQDDSESWVCLTCHKIYCSRYVKGHGLAHFLDCGHPVTASFSDLSCWCHHCEAYLKMPHVEKHLEDLATAKFGEG